MVCPSSWHQCGLLKKAWKYQRLVSKYVFRLVAVWTLAFDLVVASCYHPAVASGSASDSAAAWHSFLFPAHFSPPPLLSPMMMMMMIRMMKMMVVVVVVVVVMLGWVAQHAGASPGYVL